MTRLSKESSESLCDYLRSLSRKPVTVPRKMFHLCASELLCILRCNKGIFISPEHKGGDMSCQGMETIFPLNEILRIDAPVQFQHHATSLRLCEREGIGRTDVLRAKLRSMAMHRLFVGRKGEGCHREFS